MNAYERLGILVSAAGEFLQIGEVSVNRPKPRYPDLLELRWYPQGVHDRAPVYSVGFHLRDLQMQANEAQLRDMVYARLNEVKTMFRCGEQQWELPTGYRELSFRAPEYLMRAVPNYCKTLQRVFPAFDGYKCLRILCHPSLEPEVLSSRHFSSSQHTFNGVPLLTGWEGLPGNYGLEVVFKLPEAP